MRQPLSIRSGLRSIVQFQAAKRCVYSDDDRPRMTQSSERIGRTRHHSTCQSQHYIHWTPRLPLMWTESMSNYSKPSNRFSFSSDPSQVIRCAFSVFLSVFSFVSASDRPSLFLDSPEFQVRTSFSFPAVLTSLETSVNQDGQVCWYGIDRRISALSLSSEFPNVLTHRHY